MVEPNFQIFPKRSRDRRQQKHDFYRLALANQSVSAALYTCDALIALIMEWEKKTMSIEVGEAFVATIIISYSRPFTHNDFPGILPKRWSKFASKDLQQVHNEMISHRNNLFAHADSDIHHAIIIPNGCLPKHIGPKPPQVAYKLGRLLIPPQNVVGFRAVCSDLQPRLEKATQEALADLYGGMELPNREFRLRFDEGM